MSVAQSDNYCSRVTHLAQRGGFYSPEGDDICSSETVTSVAQRMKLVAHMVMPVVQNVTSNTSKDVAHFSDSGV